MSLMVSDAPQLTLIGRASSWRIHLPAAAAEGGIQAASSKEVDGQVLVTWLHHRSYGLIGIYTTSDVNFSGVKQQRGAWVRAVGRVRPCRVTALPDDPRSARSPVDAPLLLALASVEPIAAPRTSIAKPRLSSPQSVRVSSNQRSGYGWIGSITGWSDATIWQTNQSSAAVFSTWNTVRGVVTRFGQHRYLCYVLHYADPTEDRRERHD